MTSIMKNIILSLCVLTSLTSFGQQDPMFSQYMFNTLSVNPGYAGSRGALSMTALSRHQWVGVEGAPVTNTFSAHAPIREGQMGIGGTVVQDKIGPVSQTFGYVDVAYHMRVNQKAILSFGMKAGISAFQVNFASLNNIEQSVSPQLVGKGGQKTTPNVGAGVFYYTNEFYAGLSVPRLIAYQSDVTTDISAVQQRHYFMEAGVVKDISYAVKFKPTFLIRMAQKSPTGVDLTANFILHERLWLGSTYRVGNEVGMIAQFQLTQQLRAGYAFDYPLTDINKQASFVGTHEVMINYELIFSEKNKFKSPRFF